jgi:hypothetical protein
MADLLGFVPGLTSNGPLHVQPDGPKLLLGRPPHTEGNRSNSGHRP